MGLPAALHELFQLATGSTRDVHERPEGTRCKQVLALAPKHPHRRALRIGESTHKRRLSDTRFAAYQHQPPLARSPNVKQKLVQYGQRGITLE